jgi:hypothetical protein
VTITAYDTVNGLSGSATFTWTVTDVNVAPVLPAIGDQTNGVGDGVSLSVAATDADGDHLTYSATNLPAGLAINASTGLISGIVAASAATHSPYAVTVTASDGTLNASQSFNWTITHVLINSPGDQTNLDGDTVSLQINAWNPYGGALTYSASGLPSGLSINSTTGLISGTVGPSDSASSPYSASVTVSDGTYSATTNFNWTIAHLAVENPGDQTNAEGDVVSLQVVADINTSQTLTYSASGLPSGLSISTSTGLITGTVANLDANSSPYTITVSASDGSHNASQTFTWTITHVLLTNPGNQISAQGSAASLQLQATDPDNDTLHFGASGLPSGLSVNASTGLISGTIASNAGSGSPYTVTVTAADATHTSIQSFTWTVTNAAVTVTNPGTQNSAEGATISLPITSSDAAGDPLSFSATGLPPGLGIDFGSGAISGTIDYSAAQINSGVFHATVMASNGAGKTGSATFTWNVTNVDQAPVVTSPGDQLNLTGDVVSLTIWSYDPDGDTLTYSATNLPGGLSVNSSTGVISGAISSSANNGSPYSVTVTASDGTLNASRTFNWTVTNGALTVTQPSDQSNTEDDAVSLQISANSGFGFPLTYSALGLPTGLSMSASTGLISGTIALTAAEDVAGGLYTTTVTAADTHGHSGAATFNWTVADLHQTPTLSNPGSQTNAEGNVVSLQLQATSPSDASLTYRASGLPAGLFIDPFNGLISGTIDYSAAKIGGGHYSTLVSVNDGNGGTASQTFSWTVTDTNRPPWLAYPGFQTNKVGDTVSLQLSAGDPDGQTLTYSATGLPAGLNVNGTTGLISGSITAAAGTYSVTATVSDGSLSTSQTFSWQVTSSSPAKIILAINDTMDTSDDLAFINDGQPVQAVPVEVTLQNASAGLHQITLNTTPSGRVSLNITSFQLGNGGTTTVMLTPLQLSQAEDDVTLLALADGNQGGDAKLTVEKLGMDNHIRGKYTPANMPDRIPPRTWTDVDITLSVPLKKSGKGVDITLSGASVANGDASFKGPGGTAKGSVFISSSGTFEIAGDVGAGDVAKQTKPGNAGKLFVVVQLGGGGNPPTVLKKSAGFSVAAIPMNWTDKYLDQGVFRGMAGLIVDDGWSSDSGAREDLDQVFLSEAVEVVKATGVFVGAAVKTSGYSDDPASAKFTQDEHTVAVSLITAKGGNYEAKQLHLFNDKRTGAADIVVPKSGYKIYKKVQKDGNGDWALVVEKAVPSTKITVKLTNDVPDGPKKGTYGPESGGTTDPAGSIDTRPILP